LNKETEQVYFDLSMKAHIEHRHNNKQLARDPNKETDSVDLNQT